MKEIPLSGGSVNANQVFSVQLGDNLLEFKLSYQQSGQWACDISREGVALCSGVMLEPGADVIKHWSLSSGIGALYFIGEDTTLDNLGVNNNLIWVSPDDL